jgi:hypothetical protein
MIWAHFLQGFEAGRWETWALVLAGAGLGILAFVGGRVLLSGAAAAPPPEQKPPAEEPQRDPFMEGSTGEKRNAARRKGGVVQALVSDEKAEAEPWSGYVVDRSLGGVCVCGTRKAEPGALLTVRAVDAPPGTPWIEVRVRSCRETRDGWQLGCQFVRIPPTSLRLLFG